jgi:hypothetical protein
MLEDRNQGSVSDRGKRKHTDNFSSSCTSILTPAHQPVCQGDVQTAHCHTPVSGVARLLAPVANNHSVRT